MASERFEQQILDQVSGFGEVGALPMFGGHGLYWGETILGILFGGRLYLKVDDRSEGDYLAREMGPSRLNERQTIRSYYEVPPDVLDDPEALLSWAREAIRAGMDSRSSG